MALPTHTGSSLFAEPLGLQLVLVVVRRDDPEIVIVDGLAKDHRRPYPEAKRLVGASVPYRNRDLPVRVDVEQSGARLQLTVCIDPWQTLLGTADDHAHL